jgi:hypothetical protein
MRDIVVTTPRSEMANAAREAQICIERGGGFYFRQIRNLPRGLVVGSKVFYVEDGFVRGFAVACQVGGCAAGWRCEVTGREYLPEMVVETRVADEAARDDCGHERACMRSLRHGSRGSGAAQWSQDLRRLLGRIRRMETNTMTNEERIENFAGWGIVGEPQDGVIVDGPSGPSIDVSGYNAGDYWDGDEFLGPDTFGIVPIYKTASGQFPTEAVSYPYLA